PRNLLFVGTLTGKKGVTYLIDAFSTVKNVIPSVRLVLIGSGEDEPMLRSQVSRLQLVDSVKFLGRVDDDELIRQYQAADVFVFPSLQEGFGIPLIEAMACGVTVVSTTATSIPDVVGDAGLLVEPACSGPLARAILRILESDT
ncbi:MAG: glycosyltransferase, partial [Candidatus Marinimicrobia bacterium]|nr:glycosyltransferase [Candidatus Neomarinimicrobiota bacterium]